MENKNKTEIIFVETHKRQSRLATLQGLLSSDYKFVIPSFQRPYAWNHDNFQDLLDSIKENRENENEKNRETFLGSIIVALKKDDAAEVPGMQKYLLIDGQQRITSFLLILKFTSDNLKKCIQEKENAIENITLQLDRAKQNKDVDFIEQYTREQEFQKSKIENYKKHLDQIREILINDRITRESAAREEVFERDILKYIFTDQNPSRNSEIKRIKKIYDKEMGNDEDTEEILEYILSRCIFCFLTIRGSDSEDYAIDIFNSLNSTGEPLTAFEILKSLIHKKFKNANPKKMTKRFNDIEKELEEKKFNKIKQHKYTDRLLLFINMMTDGLQRDKISSFRDKRNLLKAIIGFGEDKIVRIIEDMYSLHKFILKNWENKRVPFYGKDVESRLVFDFLQSINHDRVIPVLYRFKDNDLGLQKALKACAAFTCLWRGVSSDGGTDQIDNKYEKIIKEIYAKQQPNIEDLTLFMLSILKEERGLKNDSENQWADKFKDINIYKKNKKKNRMARFLLFMAFHKRDFDEETQKMKKAQLKIFTTDNWSGKEYETIEHIIPQSRKRIDKIGNLILLPRKINSKAGNKNFSEKKKIYHECLKKDPNDMPYIPILKEIVSCGRAEEPYLDDAEINKRGERLGRSIWKTLAEDWLGWK